VSGSTPTDVQQQLDKQMPAGSQVTASVADDGSLKLTGTVASDADKAKAEQIAKQVSNKNVDNQIQVKSSSDQSAVPK
jgi:osmotically-inducible protein OsmY